MPIDGKRRRGRKKESERTASSQSHYTISILSQVSFFGGGKKAEEKRALKREREKKGSFFTYTSPKLLSPYKRHARPGFVSSDSGCLFFSTPVCVCVTWFRCWGASDNIFCLKVEKERAPKTTSEHKGKVGRAEKKRTFPRWPGRKRCQDEKGDANFGCRRSWVHKNKQKGSPLSIFK